MTSERTAGRPDERPATMPDRTLSGAVRFRHVPHEMTVDPIGIEEAAAALGIIERSPFVSSESR